MSEQDALKIHEVHQYTEMAHADKALAPVSLGMAILAVAVGALSMAGHRAHNGVLLAQTRANFWSWLATGRENTRMRCSLACLMCSLPPTLLRVLS